MCIVIRPEEVGDWPAIDEVNNLAFGQPNEGELVRLLRKASRFVPGLSLVAEVEGQVVGHILFYPIDIRGSERSVECLALAPMAVVPAHQNKGVGSQLVRDGLAAAGRLGFGSVVVIGHPAYYPRFGFSPASKWGIRAPFDAPDEALMALELVAGSLVGSAGILVYPDEFLAV